LPNSLFRNYVGLSHHDRRVRSAFGQRYGLFATSAKKFAEFLFMRPTIKSDLLTIIIFALHRYFN